MTRFKDKVVVVTGGNSGIGEGIAEYFHREGAKVVIFGRNEDTLNQVKNRLGHNTLTIQGDVTQAEDLKNLFNQTLSHFGKVDSLIVNSGVGERLHVSQVNEDDFDKLVDINYRGAYFTVKYALDFLNSPSSIILISSVAAHVTMKRHSVYASTKAAVKQLAKNFSCDLAERNIRINSISPGYIKTPMFNARLEQNPSYLDEKSMNIPLKRVGTPKDIASAAFFLASDEAGYITGSDLIIDGGYAASFPTEI